MVVKQEQPPITNCAYQIQLSNDVWKCYTQAEFDSYQAQKKQQELAEAPYVFGFIVLVLIFCFWMIRK